MATFGYTFLGDDEPTGMFRPAPKNLALVVDGETRLFVNSKGRVGINTKTPQARLHVGGNLLCSDGGQVYGASETDAQTPSFSWAGDADTGVFRPAEDAVGVATAGAERVRVTADGNVGVNVTSPVDRLDVDGTAQVSGQLKGSASGDAGAPAFTWTGDTDTGLFRGANDTMGVSTGGVERLRVTDAGRLGVGTTDPQETLHVNGCARAPLILTGKIILTPDVK
ncbi:MAG: hypothetical protein ABEI52_05560 [Halobacteriaceae archaeon]